MNLLVVDTETSGLPDDTPPGEIIEVAAALYNVEERAVLWSYGALLPEYRDLDDENVAVHGIRPGMLLAASEAQADAAGFEDAHDPLWLVRFMAAAHHADAIAAHGADFDRTMLARHDSWWEQAKPWVDTQHLDFPRVTNSSRKLAHLAVDHGIVSIQTHRALDDVLRLCDLLAKVSDLDHQVQEALKPQALFASCAGYEQKDTVKEHGFRWNMDSPDGQPMPPKKWCKVLPFDTPCESTDARPFWIRKVRDIKRPWER